MLIYICIYTYICISLSLYIYIYIYIRPQVRSMRKLRRTWSTSLVAWTSRTSRPGSPPPAPRSHSKNSLSKICSKGWVAQKPSLIGSLTAELRFSKGWVRKDANLGLRTGCTPSSSVNLDTRERSCET